MTFKGILPILLFTLLLSPVVLANSGNDSVNVNVVIEPIATLAASGNLDLELYYSQVYHQWRISESGMNSINIQTNDDLWIEVTSTGFRINDETFGELNDAIRYRVVYDDGNSSKPVVEIAPSGTGLFHITREFYQEHIIGNFLTFSWSLNIAETNNRLNSSNYTWTQVEATTDGERYVDTITFTAAELGDSYSGTNTGHVIVF